ncbi:DUF1475 family protein [Fusibacter bizertensis]
MRTSKIIAWVGFFAMTVGLINGFLNGDFFKDGGELFQNPWGVMSLIDLYVGFTLFSMWIAFRERYIPIAVAWILGMMVLGFFTASVYVLLSLYTSKGNWLKFFLGYQKEALVNGEIAKISRPEEQDLIAEALESKKTKESI